MRQENDEFVASESRGVVGGAEFAGDGRGRKANDFVADMVPERVIDRLEVVKVDHDA